MALRITDASVKDPRALRKVLEALATAVNELIDDHATFKANSAELQTELVNHTHDGSTATHATSGSGSLSLSTSQPATLSAPKVTPGT